LVCAGSGSIGIDVALTETISVTSTGSVINIVGLDVGNTSTDEYGFFPIDGARTLAIEDDQNQLGVILLETVTP
jgi:hypothetical protein